MKYNFVRTLALTLGVCTISNVATAQMASDPGAGLSGGAFIPGGNAGASSSAIPREPSALPPSLSVGSGISIVPVQDAGTTLTPDYSQPASIPVSPVASQRSLVAERLSPWTDEPAAAATAPAKAAVAAPSVSGACASECSNTCGIPMQSVSPWIFGANGLVFDRLGNDCTALTYNSNDPSNPLLCTRIVNMPNTGGFELLGGRYFGCGRYAIVGSYWGVFSPEQHASITPSAGIDLMSALPFNYSLPPGGPTQGLQMTGQTVSDWFRDAQLQVVTREQSFQNAEINFLSFALAGAARQPYDDGCNTGGLLHSGRGCGVGPTGASAPWFGAQNSRLRVNMLAGIRWFQFRDQLEFGASDTNAVFDYSSDDFFYRNEVTNDLWGGQLGATATWCTSRWLNLYGGTKFGVFSNRMSLNSYAGTATEMATIVSTNDSNGRNFSFTADNTDVALLGEGNVGLGIRVNRGWTANIGYRLIGVSGVATSVGQIPRDFANLNSAWYLKNDHSILLHGLTAGASYNF